MRLVFVLFLNVWPIYALYIKVNLDDFIKYFHTNASVLSGIHLAV